MSMTENPKIYFTLYKNNRLCHFRSLNEQLKVKFVNINCIKELSEFNKNIKKRQYKSDTIISAQIPTNKI